MEYEVEVSYLKRRNKPNHNTKDFTLLHIFVCLGFTLSGPQGIFVAQDLVITPDGMGPYWILRIESG